MDHTQCSTHNMTTGNNMKTSHRMFLRRDGKRGHENVLVLVDWEGVSDTDIKLMASHYVVNRAAHDLKGYDHELPQSVEYRAADFVHNEPLVTMPESPENWKASKPSSSVEAFKKALKGLSKEEVRQLLAGP